MLGTLSPLADERRDDSAKRCVGRARTARHDDPARLVATGLKLSLARHPHILRNGRKNLIAKMLREDGYEVRQYDPLIAGSNYSSLAEVAKGADLLAILVPHRRVLEEIAAKKEEIRGGMRTPTIVVF